MFDNFICCPLILLFIFSRSSSLAPPQTKNKWLQLICDHYHTHWFRPIFLVVKCSAPTTNDPWFYLCFAIIFFIFEAELSGTCSRIANRHSLCLYFDATCWQFEPLKSTQLRYNTVLFQFWPHRIRPKCFFSVITCVRLQRLWIDFMCVFKLVYF